MSAFTPEQEGALRAIVRSELAKLNPSWLPRAERRKAKAVAHRAQSASIDQVPVGTVTEAEVMARRTPAGAWDKATLASWGVPWPPPHGWRARLTKSEAA